MLLPSGTATVPQRLPDVEGRFARALVSTVWAGLGAYIAVLFLVMTLARAASRADRRMQPHGRSTTSDPRLDARPVRRRAPH